MKKIVLITFIAIVALVAMYGVQNTPKAVRIENKEVVLAAPRAVKVTKKPLTVAQKIAKNFYKCNLNTEYIRKDNAQCIKKPTTPVVEKQVAPVKSSGNCKLAYKYNWPQDIAYQICLHESGGNPNAANWSDNHMSWAGCMGSFGLFQINCSHGQLFDPEANVKTAYMMYKARGNFSAWTTCAKVAGCY